LCEGVVLGYLGGSLMPDGVCKKCGWKAPAGLLKCPFCKTYIREPGASSSSEDRAKPAVARADPALPAPDPAGVRHVQRELARELFDDSDKWPVFEGDAPPPAKAPEEDGKTSGMGDLTGLS
jgi:hypothetical protein